MVYFCHSGARFLPWSVSLLGTFIAFPLTRWSGRYAAQFMLSQIVMGLLARGNGEKFPGENVYVCGKFSSYYFAHQSLPVRTYRFSW